ncbi:MBL fold metallo-hydrolase [Deinococcus yavapaiensis]|uniref:Hydroxyacylglutathione hydrolase n=1 Tax=Deinococcus yavapaiensis KR-236 TaxID=694435 RepID=A0A318SID3_9DEIO|nr:MBL fold metallo-hydrolase [Deinococcus yavapaiensis]PYE51142.1 hydroxyacylglutathione hydrolase [Deinococcus yavapaiensis KR-236]
MILHTIKTEGLSALSYFIADEEAGCAAVVDPRRDVDVYLDFAKKHGVRITHVIETHIHADFVSGARELCTLTSATVYGGPGDYGFDVHKLQDGEELTLGKLELRALHTPGHSPDAISLVLSGGGLGAEGEWALLSGDTLFNAEVGRPDLASGVSAEDGARQLHHSLTEKFGALDDGLLVLPAHGHGSPCGGRIGIRDCTTLGYERQHNPHFKATDEASFVTNLTSDLPPQPSYYGRVKKLNASGPGYLGVRPATPWLSPQDFREAMEDPDSVVLDAREIEAYASAHLDGSLNIALRDAFPIHAGWMLAPHHRLLIVLDSPDHEEIVERHLLRLGLESILGFLRHGMRGWIEAGLPWRQGGQMSVQELRACLDANDDVQVLDVRRPDEWRTGHVPTAKHAFLGTLWEDLPKLGLDPERPVAVYCGSGYRSSMAVSILERHGFKDARNVLGSVSAWKAAGFDLSLPSEVSRA